MGWEKHKDLPFNDEDVAKATSEGVEFKVLREDGYQPYEQAKNDPNYQKEYHVLTSEQLLEIARATKSILTVLENNHAAWLEKYGEKTAAMMLLNVAPNALMRSVSHVVRHEKMLEATWAIFNQMMRAQMLDAEKRIERATDALAVATIKLLKERGGAKLKPITDEIFAVVDGDKAKFMRENAASFVKE